MTTPGADIIFPSTCPCGTDGGTVSDRIIGRARELAALEATIDRAPGAPPNLVLHGDPGVGKTVLLRAGVDHATRRGIRVLSCTGYETEAELAFSGLYQLFAPVMEYLDRVEPFHRSVIRRILGFEDGPP